MNANNAVRKLIKFIAAYVCTIAIGLFTGFGITNIDIVLPLLCLILYLLIDTADRLILLKDRCDDAGVLGLIKGMTVKGVLSELKYSLPLAALFALTVVIGRHYDIWGGSISSLSVADILLWILLTAGCTFGIIILYAYRDARRGKGDDASGNIRDMLKKDLDDSSANTEDTHQDTESNLIVNKPDVHSRSVEDAPAYKKRYLIYVLILLLCWLPYYLTMFPGNLGKDTFESIDMVLGNIPWTNHHPIFFTALIALVYKLTAWVGSMTVTMGIFTFLHMVAFACTLAYIVVRIYKHEKMCGCESIDVSNNDTRVREIRWSNVALVFFALHPFMGMYSIYITKDVLFSCALCLLVFSVYDVAMMASGKRVEAGSDASSDTTGIEANTPDAKRGGAKNDAAYARNIYIRLALTSLAVMLLRNNGLMIVALLLIILCIVYRREIKRLLPVMLIPIVVFVAGRSAAYRGLDVSAESFAEAAAIPLQQIGYVVLVHEDDKIDEVLGSEYAEVLKSIMLYDRVRDVYTLGYADPYKFDADFEDVYFNAHRAEFFGIWGKLLLRYPGDFVKAYLAQTAGYWHYGETNTVATQGVWEDNEIGVVRTDIIEQVTGLSLYGIIEKLMLGMRKAPLFCILSSMAMQLYALLLAICVALRERSVTGKSRYAALVVASAPLLILWISIMVATPAFCLFRYMFPYFMMWPCILYVIAGVRKD